MSRTLCTRYLIKHRNRVSGVINKQPLPGHRLADARRFADLPEAHPKRVLEPQHVTYFAHRQSLRWHREPRSVAGSLITRFDRRRERRSARNHRLSAIIGTLSGLRRNPVRNASDSAFKSDRDK